MSPRPTDNAADDSRLARSPTHRRFEERFFRPATPGGDGRPKGPGPVESCPDPGPPLLIDCLIRDPATAERLPRGPGGTPPGSPRHGWGTHRRATSPPGAFPRTRPELAESMGEKGEPMPRPFGVERALRRVSLADGSTMGRPPGRRAAMPKPITPGPAIPFSGPAPWVDTPGSATPRRFETDVPIESSLGPEAYPGHQDRNTAFKFIGIIAVPNRITKRPYFTSELFGHARQGL